MEFGRLENVIILGDLTSVSNKERVNRKELLEDLIWGRNEKEERLIGFCKEYNVIIANTIL